MTTGFETVINCETSLIFYKMISVRKVYVLYYILQSTNKK